MSIMHIKDTITKVKGVFIELMETVYTDTKNNIKTWEWVRRVNERRAVLIAATYEDAVTRKHSLVVTKEYRVPLDDHQWGFPAGLIDGNEALDVTIRRELKEETGLDIDKITHISPFVYNSAGLTNESISIVYCVACGTPNTNNTEASEDIEVFLMDADEIRLLLSDPTKKIGAKAYLLMERFITFGEL